MKEWTDIRNRYLRDPVPTRLGGLAANLARIASFSDHDGHQGVVRDLIVESKYFIEWTTNDADADNQEQLVRLQVHLARWHIWTDRHWDDRALREAMAESAQNLSARVLEMSGLVGEAR